MTGGFNQNCSLHQIAASYLFVRNEFETPSVFNAESWSTFRISFQCPAGCHLGNKGLLASQLLHRNHEDGLSFKLILFQALCLQAFEFFFGVIVENAPGQRSQGQV